MLAQKKARGPAPFLSSFTVILLLLTARPAPLIGVGVAW